MASIRQNPVTGDYVVIATERAKRPQDFVKPKIDKKSISLKDCPFCEQNISQQKIITNASFSDVYVLENKFPAFNLENHVDLQFSGELYYSAHSLGSHEVIVLKDHSKDLQDMQPHEIDVLLQVYQNRLIVHKNNPFIGYSLVIHNHGAEAGASIAHPHSQIFASEIIPPNLKKELEGSKEWYIKNNSCVFCDILKQEKELNQRIVCENEDFMAITAFAPKFSGELWILPKNHVTNFELIKHDSRRNLAKILSEIIKKLDIGFGDPAYNFFIHTAPFKNYDCERYFHYHIEIVPRVTVWGGYELGAGMPIDILLPESVSGFFKDINIK